MPVLFTPGVNETTVAEHAFGLMIAVAKNFWFHLKTVKAGNGNGRPGIELFGKTLGILGMGRIGKEVVKRGRRVWHDAASAIDNHWDDDFARAVQTRPPAHARRCAEAGRYRLAAYQSHARDARLHQHAIASRMMKDGAILINTARGGVVVEAGRRRGLQIGQAVRLRRRCAGCRADENAARFPGNRQYHRYAARRQPDV